MKSYQKLVAALLAVLLIVSAAGCAPMTLAKEWSYEYDDDTLSEKLDIGVYIYSLYQAYSNAKTYAEKAEDYKDNESFMDIEITDDDGNKALAKDWIKTEAEKITVNLLAVDYLVEKHGATWDEASMESAEQECKNAWEMGPYSSYGYYQPMSKELEPFGVSYDSFKLSSYVANVKQNAIFDVLYNEGGEKAVSDKEFTKYFTENYVDYSYIPVEMYTSESDAEGNSTSVAFGKKKMNSTIDKLESLAKNINSDSTTFDKAVKSCVKELKIDESAAVEDTVELLTTTEGNNADIAKALKSLDNGKAKVITVGKDGDSPMAYLVLKNDISRNVEHYLENKTEHSSVLQSMKSDEFTDFIEKTADDMLKSDKLSKNSGVIDRYDPNMFFVKAEETTAATEDEDAEAE